MLRKVPEDAGVLLIEAVWQKFGDVQPHHGNSIAVVDRPGMAGILVVQHHPLIRIALESAHGIGSEVKLNRIHPVVAKVLVDQRRIVESDGLHAEIVA